MYDNICLFYFLNSPLYFIMDLLSLNLPGHSCGIYLTRGKESRKYLPLGFEYNEDKDSYGWWIEGLLADGLNEAFKKIATSCLKFGNHSIGAIMFWTTVKGVLPHLSCMFHKP